MSMEQTNINLMNRTNHTQLTPYDQNEMKQKVAISSMKIFDGEDLTYGDRQKLQQIQQRDWIQQQIQEKQAISQNLDQESKAFQDQTLTINKMREELEKLHHKKRTDMMKAQKETNLQLMYEKYDREKNQKYQDEQDKQNHINYTTNNLFMTENTQTCQSELAQHRVIPYHWKGMNQYQKTEILQTVDQQRRENEIQAELKKDEEKQFAIQTESDRLMVVNLEREKKKRQKEMFDHMKEFNLLAAKEQKLKLKHYYD